MEKQTSPPDYLTEAELISLMERHGIGTDASIPVHINNICERNYVTVAAGRRLQPTTLGVVLVHGYQKVGRINHPILCLTLDSCVQVSRPNTTKAFAPNGIVLVRVCSFICKVQRSEPVE